MNLRIFNRRCEEIRKQAGEIPPGQLTQGNTVVRAGREVCPVLPGSVRRGDRCCWYLLGQVDQDSDAYETLRSSADNPGASSHSR